MARLSRLCPQGIPQHIIQRGNNRQSFFACDEDVAAYLLCVLNSSSQGRILPDLTQQYRLEAFLLPTR